MAERRLRVLHVVRQFEPAVGGLESYVAELARRQAETFDVTILTLDRVFGDPARLPHHERRGPLTVRRVSFAGGRRLFVPFVDPRVLRDADIVHVHAADQLLDVIAALARVRRVPLFMTTHGLFFHTEALARIKQIYLRTITKWSLGRCGAVFAVSGNDAETLQRIGIKTELLRNPIVPLGDKLCAGDGLLYIGRVSENKRLEALVPFMAHLVKRQPGTVLHVVGKDTEGLWARIEQDIDRRGLRDNIVYHGFLTPGALLDVAGRCGFAVSASRFEGFGLAMVESMSIGLLPCMHANEAFREIQERSGCGLLTDFDAPERAADAFAAWRGTVTTADRERAQRFAHAQSWEAVSNSYAQFYRSAAGRGEAAPSAGSLAA